MKEFFKKIGRGIVKGAIYAYCKIVYRMKVVGKENIPKSGQVIICGNHKSFLDPPAIEVTCGRYTRFLAKEELTRHKFLKFLGIVFDAILVKRDSKDINFDLKIVDFADMAKFDNTAMIVSHDLYETFTESQYIQFAKHLDSNDEQEMEAFMTE